MSKLLDYQIREANALSDAAYFRKEIDKYLSNKPEKRADPKIVAAKLRAQRMVQKMLS